MKTSIFRPIPKTKVNEFKRLNRVYSQVTYECSSICISVSWANYEKCQNSFKFVSFYHFLSYSTKQAKQFQMPQPLYTQVTYECSSEYIYVSQSSYRFAIFQRIQVFKAKPS